MIIVLGFVSDWTSDSHLTHYLPCKTMVFQCRPKLQSVYVGPQIGMNPELVRGSPNLEF